MYQEIIQLISHYLDIHEIYRIKDLLNLNIKIYLKNVKCPIKDKKYRKYTTYECCEDCESDLAWASFYGYLEIVKYLAPTHNNSGDPDSPINLASWRGHLEIFKFLYDNNYYKEFEIDDAYQHGHLDILEFFDSKNKTKTLKKELRVIKSNLNFPEKINRIITKYLKN